MEKLPKGWEWARGHYEAKRAVDGASVIQRMGGMNWWCAYLPGDARPVRDETGGSRRFSSPLAAIAHLEGAK